MSLLKIPLVLSSAIAVQVAVTPPHSPSTEELYDRSRLLLYAHKMTYPSRSINIQGLYWMGVAAETAAIMARRVDSSKIPLVLRAASEALKTLTDVPITPSFLVGCGLVTSGGFIRWLCYRTLGRYFTFLLSVRQGHHRTLLNRPPPFLHRNDDAVLRNHHSAWLPQFVVEGIWYISKDPGSVTGC